jgi:hypothetical protein
MGFPLLDNTGENFPFATADKREDIIFVERNRARNC